MANTKTPKGSIICVYRELHLFINDNADKAMTIQAEKETTLRQIKSGENESDGK